MKYYEISIYFDEYDNYSKLYATNSYNVLEDIADEAYEKGFIDKSEFHAVEDVAEITKEIYENAFK